MFEWTLMKRLIWIKAAVISGAASLYETVTGAIVSFVALHAKALKKLVVNIEPVQDLHGYDAPWPPGGGKNLLDPDERTNTNNNIHFYFGSGFLAKANQAYTFSVSDAAAQLTVFKFDGSTIVVNYGKTALTFTPTEDVLIKLDAYYSGGYQPSGSINDVKCQLEKGSSASSWTPYANECPISGWTGVKVTAAGENLYSRNNGQYNVPVYATDGTSAPYPDVNVVWIKVKPSTKYTIVNQPNPNAYYVRWIECDENKGYVWRDPSTMSDSVSSRTYTTRANTHYLQIAVNQWNAAEIARNDWEICVQEGEDTEYHAYSGQEIDVPFPAEAGTVYGGTDEVIGGKLADILAEIDLGTLSWTYFTSAGHERFVSNVLTPAAKPAPGGTLANALSSLYRLATSNQVYAHSFESIFCIDGDGKIQIYDARFSDAATFKTAVSGVKVVYERAEPQQFTHEEHEISTQVGTNTIWADAGDVEVTYYAK